jgi:hypothetical protein
MSTAGRPARGPRRSLPKESGTGGWPKGLFSTQIGWVPVQVLSFGAKLVRLSAPGFLIVHR